MGYILALEENIILRGFVRFKACVEAPTLTSGLSWELNLTPYQESMGWLLGGD